jgi:hypothetical protein
MLWKHVGSLFTIINPNRAIYIHIQNVVDTLGLIYHKQAKTISLKNAH